MKIDQILKKQTLDINACYFTLGFEPLKFS